MNNDLLIEIGNIKGINKLEINMSLEPNVYAITGINGIGKSTLLSCVSPRLKRPINFLSLTNYANENSYIKYKVGDNEEIWNIYNNQWLCNGSEDITEKIFLRGFQEGSLTNGTRFFNIFSLKFRNFKSIYSIRKELLISADDFVKENLGLLLQNDKDYYSDLYRLDRKS